MVEDEQIGKLLKDQMEEKSPWLLYTCGPMGVGKLLARIACASWPVFRVCHDYPCKQRESRKSKTSPKLREPKL